MSIYIPLKLFLAKSFNVLTYFHSLVQDCSYPIVNALELLQSSTKPSMYALRIGATQHQSIVFYLGSL